MHGAKVEKCYSRQELNAKATVMVVDSTPIRFYLRTAEHLYKQASVYQAEGDIQTCYILYLRFCNLVITELRKHSEYSSPTYKAAILGLKKSAVGAMNEVEKLNPIIDKKYNDYLEYIKKREEERRARELEASMQQEQSISQHYSRFAESNMTGKEHYSLQNNSHHSGTSDLHPPKEEQDTRWATIPPNSGWSLAQELAGVPGINTAIAGRSMPHQTHQHHHQHQHQHHHSQPQHDGREVLQIQYPEHHRRQPLPIQHPVLTPTRPPAPTPPPVPTSPFASTPSPVPSISQYGNEIAPRGPPPALPKKPVIFNDQQPPKLPPKISLEEDIHDFTEGLRTLIVPVRLLDRFLNIVRPNTVKKLETCGILAGILSRNKLTVTTLIIPKQTATSDTCSTTNEDELFEFQSNRDLMTLGWIHTHPTQTCFMSSVDLHTHCSYQLMLPEAIAIVCAPKFEKDYGVFRLTDPPGLQVITNCRQKALFHQHPGEDDIYTDACFDGHVEFVDLDLEIVDLRNR